MLAYFISSWKLSEKIIIQMKLVKYRRPLNLKIKWFLCPCDCKETFWYVLWLVIGFTFNPAARWEVSHSVLAAFIIDKNGSWEGQSREPPVEFQGVHSQTFVHARCVGGEGSKASLKDKTKIKEIIIHALLHHRQSARLTDDEISPLDYDNGYKEGSVASVPKFFALSISQLLAKWVLQVIDS